jgi:hypothetical protein
LHLSLKAHGTMTFCITSTKRKWFIMIGHSSLWLTSYKNHHTIEAHHKKFIQKRNIDTMNTIDNKNPLHS